MRTSYDKQNEQIDEQPDESVRTLWESGRNRKKFKKMWEILITMLYFSLNIFMSALFNPYRVILIIVYIVIYTQ